MFSIIFEQTYHNIHMQYCIIWTFTTSNGIGNHHLTSFSSSSFTVGGGRFAGGGGM